MKDKQKKHMNIAEHASSNYPEEKSTGTTILLGNLATPARTKGSVKSGGKDTPEELDGPGIRALRKREEEKQKNDLDNFEKEEKRIRKYNEEDIYDVHELYRNFEPYQREVIIRCFLMDFPKTEGGLIPQIPLKVKIPSQAHPGVFNGDEDAQWKFKFKGIVIAVHPSHKQEFQFGDVIQVEKDAVRPFAWNKNLPQELRYGFWFPDLFPGEIAPKNYDDPSFGYFKIPLDLVTGFISKVPRDGEKK